MRIDELEQIYASTQASDWVKIDGGPMFLHSYIVESGDDTAHISHVEYHHSLAVLRSDVDVRIAWGFDPDYGDRRRLFFSDTWAAESVELADVFYRGALVQRHWVVSVDDDRGLLPMPSRRRKEGTDAGSTDPADYEDRVYRRDVNFARLLTNIRGGREFDDQLVRSGVRILD